MSVWVVRFASSALVCFSVLRWASLPSLVAVPDDQSMELVRSMRFDSGAYVGVTSGADGLPGIANVDDGANGIVDDPIELGATGSDDRLVVMSDDEYSRDPAALPLVLARGAWVDGEGPGDRREFFRGGDWEWMGEE